jgi:hypothetical protein
VSRLIPRLAHLSLAAFALIACSSVSRQPPIPAAKIDTPPVEYQRRSLMVGTWLGRAPLKEGGQRSWLMQRHNDGTFVVTFKFQQADGDVERSQEYGIWGLTSPIYFTVTQGWIVNGRRRPADPTSPYFYDAYRTIRIDDKQHVYRSYSTGSRFTVKRVPDNFDPDDL